jgi:hypothetical protein
MCCGNISREFVGTRTSASSAIVGPHVLWAAVVDTTSGSLNTSAAFAEATTLCFQLSEGNVTHSAVQADLVIDEYHGGIFTRDVTSA